MHTDLSQKYSHILALIETLPEPEKAKTTQRFLLLKEFTDIFEKQEKKKQNKKYRRKAAIKQFCQKNDISVTSFYRWEKIERTGGIEGLIPHHKIWGWENETIIFYKSASLAATLPKWKSIVAQITLNTKRPLTFLPEMIEFIENRPEIDRQTKEGCLLLLNFIHRFSKRKFTTPLDLPLTKKDKALLETYKNANHKNHSAKANAMLMAHRHCTIFEIVVATGRSRTTIYNWLRLFKEKGLNFVETRMDPTEREKILNERTQRVIGILHSPPSTYDINRTSWTYDTLIQAYKQVHGDQLSKGIMQRVIKNTNYTWRHARKVLTSHDPNYQKKVAKVLKTLRNVKENEAFFFVDELGPYKVKSYGGKSLTAEGVTKTVPERPTIKGEVQAIAALEAFTNQMTWGFTSNKNSDTIILILDMLVKKYPEKERLFITWDGISSHRSGRLLGWVKDYNNKAKKNGIGPIVKIVPLPSCAQFLNVIESVFGGMKKAVILNSDYASKADMEAAIDRHFKERNVFYKLNPKRVGDKIWDEQAFEVEELPGGLFKKM